MKLALVSMPMVDLRYPSLGLTKLHYMIKSRFDETVACDILYLCHDFAKCIGIDVYNFILHELNSGLGEWFFQKLAFPLMEDTTEKYFNCYYAKTDEKTKNIMSALLGQREGLNAIFDFLLAERGLCAYDVVGFTSMFLQNTASLAMARKVKEKKPDTITVVGGANVEFPMGIPIVQHVPYIDFVFSGPALKSLPDFIASLYQGDYAKLHEINGIWSKENVSNHSHSAATSFSFGERIDIDTPFELEYDSFLESYEKQFPNTVSKPYLFFSTSEGCWWGEKQPCTFCAQGGTSGNNMTYSYMQPKSAIQLIESLNRYQGRADILYSTDSIVPRCYPSDVFSNIRSNIPIHLELDTHAVDEESIRLLSRAGVKVAEAGIESLSTESLRLMKKGASACNNLRFMMNCMMNDIYIVWNYLLGAPGENEQIYRKICDDIPKLTHFPPPEPTAVTFERFSEYHKRPDEYRLCLKPLAFYDLTYPFSQDDLAMLAYNFRDHGSAEYKKALNRWIGKILARCERWKSLWKSDTFPYLYFEAGEDTGTIIDSRTGEVRKHTISEYGAELLRLLHKPSRIRDLKDDFPNDALDSELDALLAKGLLFCDGEVYYSIVFPRKPPHPSFLSS